MKKQTDVLTLDRQLCFSLYTASRLMTQAYRSILDPVNLTYPQYLVLLVLWETDGISVNALGERLLLDSGTLSPLLKKLEFKGYLTRTRDPQDERTLALSLTTQGQKLRGKLIKTPEAIACLTEVPLAELVKMKARVDAFAKDVQKYVERPHDSD